MPGLTCVNNVGAAFAMTSGTDVCLKSGCGTVALGSANFCSAACPCGHGGADCDSNAECLPGLVCGTNNGAAFGYSATTDVCVPG
jgi:lipoprotein signal peptidase